MLHRHAAIGLLIVALALSVRALIPVGYMTNATPGGLTVELCSGMTGKSVTIALPGKAGDHDKGKTQADSPCAFSSLGLAATAAVDPLLLAIAIAFIVALGLRLAPAPLIAAREQLRPPLRGPPLEA